MQLNRTENPVSRKERIKINENWDTIEKGVNDIIADVNDHAEAIEDNRKVATEALNTATQIDGKVDATNKQAEDANEKAEAAITSAKAAVTVANGIDGKATEALNKSNEAVSTSKSARDTAQQAKVTAEATAKQINDVIKETGDTNAEVIASRTDVNTGETFNTIGDRLNNQKLVQQRTNDVVIRQNGNQAVTGFLFDDSPVNDYTILLPITAQYNVPVSIAVISGYTNQPNYLMHSNHISKLRELESVHSWDLLAHTDTHPRLADLTYEQQEKEMVDCINKMVSAGFKRPRGIVYPYGSFNDDTITLARKHFEFGTRAGTNKTNSCPIDTYRIQRIQFDFTNPNNAFWWYKQQVDRAYKNGEAIIFMGHTLVVTDGRNWFDEQQQQLMREVIEYIQSIGMPIKTVSDIYDMFKNVYDSPIYEESIGANGKRLDETNYGTMTYTTSADIKATTLYADLPNGVTRKTFLVADGETFIESNGGELTTYKYELPDLSYQIWQPAGKRTTYKRTPINSGAGWSNWRKVGVSDDDGYTDNNFVLTQNLTSLLSDYPYGRSVRFLTGLTDFKDGTSGTLITYKHMSGALSWQEFHPTDSGNVYKRASSPNGSAWRKWRTVGDVQLTDSSTNDTLPSTYVVGRTVELLTSAYVQTQSFPVTTGGAMLITETTAEPSIITTQRLIDKDGYEYTRMGLNDVWAEWRSNKLTA